MKELQPAYRLRQVEPKVCGTCKFGYYEYGSFLCRRPGVPPVDAGDGRHWHRTCDRWASILKSTKNA